MYKYGLYISSIAAEIKGIDIDKVNKNYKEVYKTIVSFLNDPEGHINRKKRQILIVLSISLLLTICIGLLLGV